MINMTYQDLESMGFKIKIVENFVPDDKHAKINAKTLSRQGGKLSKVTQYELIDIEGNIIITSSHRLHFVDTVNAFVESYCKSIN